MLTAIIYVLVGLGLILAGANMLTDGASSVARRWGVSDMVIGLTVVAFGTSAPELVISVVSAVDGSAELAIGNVVGSNIFNVLVIVGLTALVSPIHIGSDVMTKDIPLVVLSALVLLTMGNAQLLDGAAERVIGRMDGILLLLFFTIFMRHTFSAASTAIDGDETPHAAGDMPVWKALLRVVMGLVGLIFGGDLFVDGASSIASGLGVSEAIIGLTIVSAGTSLPELATSVTAALKGKPGIALGNVIGSNIFNIFLVLGCSATVRQLPLGGIGNVDLLVLTGACLLFWIFGWSFRKRTITRPEGAVLFLCYIGYTAWLVAQSI